MASDMKTIRFSNDVLAVTLAPEFGGRLATLRLKTRDGERDLAPPLTRWTDDPLRWPKAGAYPLVPYSNRVAHALLKTSGRALPLRAHPDAAPHTLHGPGHLRAWSVATSDAKGAELILSSSADADWPWAYEARQRFSLDGARLRLSMEIRNCSDEAFPAGLGWHPYLIFGAGAKLHHDARSRWPFDADYVSTGAREPASSDGRRTDYLSDWRSVRLTRADGVTIDIDADPIFDHLVLHRPDTDAYACVEPVTHASNGFNLAAQGVADTGTRILQPGETMGGEIRLRIATT